MVPPSDFCFNAETAQDNEFQQKTDQPHYLVKESALEEFTLMVNQLRDHHVEVLLLNKHHGDPEMPDAVFPNNWFCTRHDGTIDIMPMKTPNRRLEARPEALAKLLEHNGYQIREINQLQDSGEAFLEGTGAMIFDHRHTKTYAALSERCDSQLLADYNRQRGYETISFNSFSRKATPFYHTNVMMSVGEQFAVICLDSITDPQQRASVESQLKADKKQIIDISLAQAEEHFCANVIQLRNLRNDPVIVLSGSAYHGFTKEQRQQISAHGKLIPCDIHTIESIGGGSARCMIAENFLPRQ
ncbi:arginine deiminase-related protein [Kangiella marina]|uniref:Arginine deiminase-related protein n=2 Tax=Kangiella marina TaxID=1079178 RepID=A0ABP8IFG8_9GAMM